MKENDEKKVKRTAENSTQTLQIIFAVALIALFSLILFLMIKVAKLESSINDLQAMNSVATVSADEDASFSVPELTPEAEVVPAEETAPAEDGTSSDEVAAAPTETAKEDTTSIETLESIIAVYDSYMNSNTRRKNGNKKEYDAYYLVDINGDGYPELFYSDGNGFCGMLTIHEGTVVDSFYAEIDGKTYGTDQATCFYGGMQIYYQPGENNFFICYDNFDKEPKQYYMTIGDDGLVKNTGFASFDGSTYSIATRSNVAKKDYDNYRAQFGVYEESFANNYDDMSYSISEAFEQYLKR